MRCDGMYCDGELPWRKKREPGLMRATENAIEIDGERAVPAMMKEKETRR